MRRGPNPILIGAATVLAAITAVFISYNANSGLPFVPTYEIYAQIPNGSKLVAGNEVFIGSFRAGLVTEIKPQRVRGEYVARLKLKLDDPVGPLPKDTTVRIRNRSAVGLKYVQLETPGGRTEAVPGEEAYPEGATIPVRFARAGQEFDDFLATFDRPTRRAVKENLTIFSNAFVGRGTAINEAIVSFSPFFQNLGPVAGNLSSPATNLNRGITGFARFSAELQPLALNQAQLFTSLNVTFGAWADSALAEFFDALPAELRTYPEPLREIRPLIDHSATLAHELRPGLEALPGAARELEIALRVGQPALRRSQQLSASLEDNFRSLDRLVSDPLVSVALNKLRETVDYLYEPFTYAGPAQFTCNYAALWFRNVSAVLAEGNEVGNWFRFTPVLQFKELSDSRKPENPEFRANPYGHVGEKGFEDECEIGNEIYGTKGQQRIGNTAEKEPATTEVTKRPPLSEVKE